MKLEMLPSLPGSEICFDCRGCCIFSDAHSHWIPYFSSDEIEQAIVAGLSSDAFLGREGGRIIPTPLGDAVRCPALDPITPACTIYDLRPLDCQLYPFILMWDTTRENVFLALHEACPFVERDRLPPALIKRGVELTDLLQSPPMIETLSKNKKMIMDSDPDTIVIGPLDRLTAVFKTIL